MKNLIVLVLCQIAIGAFAQDCGIAARINDEYLNDSKIMALRGIHSDSSGDYADSIEIPPGMVNKYLDALSVIYSMDNEATDTVFNIYKIHTLPDVPYKEIAMLGDTNYAWIKNYLIDSIESGNSQFDALMQKYDFKLQSYKNLSLGVSMIVATTNYLNLQPIVDSLQNIPGLSNVDAMESRVGDGNNIEVSEGNDTCYVSFSIGWGDCPAGCTHRRFWKFSVYACNAVYLGSSGQTYTSVKNIDAINNKIYPNPVNDLINVEHWHDIKRIIVTDLYGKQILSFDQISNTLDLSELKTGHYILSIVKNEEIEILKILKR